MNNVLQNINEAMPKLSKNHRKIANYIMSNIDDAAFFTAAKIGTAVGVSESTVVRFATAVGYDGYPALSEAMAIFVKNKLNAEHRVDLKNTAMEPAGILNYVLNGDAAKIAHTIENIDTGAFEIAVDNILKARKIYIVGIRECAPLAELMAFYLKLAVDNIAVVTTSSSSEIFEQMIDLAEGDLVIGISFPRYSIRTLKALEFANNRNVNVMTITDSVHSPMTLYSSCNLFARTDMTSVVDSLVAPMSVINAVVVAVCAKQADRVVARLEAIEQVRADYQVDNNDALNYLDDDIVEELRGIK